MSEAVTVSIEILGKQFQVSCGVSEVQQVSAAAQFLNERMNEIHETRKVLGFDRIAVMAALNIAHDYLSAQGDRNHVVEDTEGKVGELTDKVTEALAEAKS